MADVPRPADSNTETDDDGDSHSTPRWVKVFGSIGVVLVLLFVILHLAGGGFRHLHIPSGEPGSRASPSSLPEPSAKRP